MKTPVEVVESALANWGDEKAQEAFGEVKARCERAEKEREETLRMWREYKAAKDADVASAKAEVDQLNEALAEEHAKAEGAYARGLEAHASELARAEADNAALLALVKEASGASGPSGSCFYCGSRADVQERLLIHASGCRGYFGTRENHPGAALLDELEGLRKQVAESKVGHLVRAEILKRERDAALEEAAKVADGYCVPGARRDKWTNGNASGIADDIRALKKTGQGA